MTAAGPTPRASAGRPGRGAAVVAGLVLGLYATLALLGRWLAPHSATALAGSSLRPPGTGNPLGTNLLGQDILSQLVLGTRASLVVAVLAGSGTVLLGGVIGVAAGWAGGWADAVVMRVTNLVLVLPKLPLLLLVGALTGGSALGLSIVLPAAFWPSTALILRSQVLSLRTRTHLRAAEGFGATGWYLVRRHVVPALALLSVAELVPAAARAVALQAGLAFLGVGDPSEPSWGAMIRDAISFPALFVTPAWLWWLLPPVLALVGLVLAITLLGAAAERILVPRVGRHHV